MKENITDFLYWFIDHLSPLGASALVLFLVVVVVVVIFYIVLLGYIIVILIIDMIKMVAFRIRKREAGHGKNDERYK